MSFADVHHPVSLQARRLARRRLDTGRRPNWVMLCALGLNTAAWVAIAKAVPLFL